MDWTCPGCGEELLPSHVKDFVKQADGTYVVWHNQCNADRIAEDQANRMHRAEARIAELEAALRGIVYDGWPEHASVRRRELERGIGTATKGGMAWLAAFSALGVPVRIKGKKP